MKNIIIKIDGCGSLCPSFITTPRVNYYKCLKTDTVFHGKSTIENNFPPSCPLPEVESGSGQNSAELAELILQKYKRNVDPSIRCCDFLKEAVIEVLDSNSLPCGENNKSSDEIFSLLSKVEDCVRNNNSAGALNILRNVRKIIAP